MVEEGKCPTPCKREGGLSGRGKARGNMYYTPSSTDYILTIFQFRGRGRSSVGGMHADEVVPSWDVINSTVPATKPITATYASYSDEVGHVTDEPETAWCQTARRDVRMTVITHARTH